LKKETKYDQVLQRLKKEYAILMIKYLSKLHDAYHEDNGLQVSHEDIVKRIKLDCMSICSEKLGSIAYDDRTEEQVIEEILQYNYDMADIQHMREVEKIDLYPLVNWLNENCVKRTEPQWFQFGIHELIANGKANPGTIGSRRTQFCKFCGEEIYVSMDHAAYASKHKRRLKT
jgi:hypothetical protein